MWIRMVLLGWLAAGVLASCSAGGGPDYYTRQVKIPRVGGVMRMPHEYGGFYIYNLDDLPVKSVDEDVRNKARVWKHWLGANFERNEEAAAFVDTVEYNGAFFMWRGGEETIERAQGPYFAREVRRMVHYGLSGINDTEEALGNTFTQTENRTYFKVKFVINNRLEPSKQTYVTTYAMNYKEDPHLYFIMVLRFENDDMEDLVQTITF